MNRTFSLLAVIFLSACGVNNPSLFFSTDTSNLKPIPKKKEKVLPRLIVETPKEGGLVTRRFRIKGECYDATSVVVESKSLLEGEVAIDCNLNRFSTYVQLKLESFRGAELKISALNDENLAEMTYLNVVGNFDLPLVIPGLEYWMDGVEEGMFFKDSLCTERVLADGDEIGCWISRNSTEHKLTQSKKNRRPQYFKGKGLYFDGDNDSLEDSHGGDYLNGLSGFEFIAVIRSHEVGVDRAFWDTGKINLKDDIPSLRFDEQGANTGCIDCMKIGIRTELGEVQTESKSSLQSLDSFITGASWSSSSIVKIYANGAESISGSPQPLSGSLKDISNFIIGNGTKKAWKGEIAEVLFFNRELKDYERGPLINWLAYKWNIQL